MAQTIEGISTAEFETAIQQYITWAAAWDGSLPADVFFGIWAEFQQEKKPLKLQARIIEDQLQYILNGHSSKHDVIPMP